MADLDNSVEYRDIQGFPGYRVGSDGSVWSCWQGIGLCRKITEHWRMLRQSVKHGWVDYKIIHLAQTGKQRQYRVNILVCEAFHGPKPPGKQAAHENGNSFDNRSINLSWKTRLENAADAIRHGTQVRGEKCWQSKLTERDVAEIRIRIGSGEKIGEIARSMNVRYIIIWDICKGRTWRHVL